LLRRLLPFRDSKERSERRENKREEQKIAFLWISNLPNLMVRAKKGLPARHPIGEISSNFGLKRQKALPIIEK
jgi:hypothetical protein